MEVRVDAVAGVVTAGDRAWPLALDYRTGGAVVEVDSVAHEVLPLRWCEKQRLARWAHLGVAFVSDQLARAAHDASAGDDPGSGAVVAAVAAWLNGADPSDESAPPGLPFDGRLLSAVTLEVCTGAGLTPRELDDRDAAEVESMWAALRGHAIFTPGRSGPPPEDRAWADATRIEIVADRAGDDEDRVSEAFTAEAETPSDRDPAGAAGSGWAASSAETSAVTAARPAAPASHAAGPVESSPRAAPPVGSSRARRSTDVVPRFRVVPCADPALGVHAPATTPVSAPARGTATPLDVTPVGPDAAPSVRAAGGDALAPTTLRSSLAVPPSTIETDRRLADLPRRHPSEAARASRHVDPVDRVEELASEVLEVLMDEVEDAAADLGIEV